MQGQGAGPSTAYRTMPGSSYSKKIEIFNNSGEYNGSKVKFKEWWAKAQAWLKVNEHAISASLQDAISTILSQLKQAPSHKSASHKQHKKPICGHD